jgi:hypothetical protein
VGKRSRLLETVEHAVFMVTLKLCEGRSSMPRGDVGGGKTWRRVHTRR